MYIDPVLGDSPTEKKQLYTQYSDLKTLLKCLKLNFLNARKKIYEFLLDDIKVSKLKGNFIWGYKEQGISVAVLMYQVAKCKCLIISTASTGVEN